jgi:arogenate/prephenate dehydratase
MCTKVSFRSLVLKCRAPRRRSSRVRPAFASDARVKFCVRSRGRRASSRVAQCAPEVAVCVDASISTHRVAAAPKTSKRDGSARRRAARERRRRARVERCERRRAASRASVQSTSRAVRGVVARGRVVARASVDPTVFVASSDLRVAYQGVPGAYSEGAALAAYENCETVPKEQFDDVYAATEAQEVDRAVLPFENSLGGSIHRNYDLILTHKLHVVGEVYYRVNHCLLALPGQRVADLTRAQSHPQALAQCEGYLTNLKMVREAVDDTAGAAKAIAEAGAKGVAAVASRRAAELYGLEVYDEGIQDDKSNVTRFLALSREPIPAMQTDVPYKTSIAVSLKEEPGALFKALACFSLRDINMTKIESRPMRTNPVTSAGARQSMQFTYLFYIDFEANMADENMQNALRHLQESATFLRVLGSYPRDCSQL